MTEYAAPQSASETSRKTSVKPRIGTPDHLRTSDDKSEPSVWHSTVVQQQIAGQVDVTVRVVRRGHNETFGAAQIEVEPGDGSWRRGKIVVCPDTPFMHRLNELDPLIDGLSRDETRQLFPRFKVTVRKTHTHWEVVGHVPLTMNSEDEAHKSAQDTFDRLHQVRREIGLGIAEGNNIFRQFQRTGDENWADKAIAAMWFKYHMHHFRENDNDCPVELNAPWQPFDTQGYKMVETPELTAALGRGKGEPPVDDELTRPWIDNANERGKFWGKVNGDPEDGFNARDESRAWTADRKTEFVHMAIGGRLHETKLGRPAAEQRVLMAIKKFFTDKDNPMTEKTAETPASGISLHPKPNDAPAGKSEPQTYPNYPESPVVVYPMANGSTIYKGIKFSVTLRLGGTIAMAVELMEKFHKAHTEKVFEIDHSCLINTGPMQNAATGGSVAPSLPTLPMAGQPATLPVPAAPDGAKPDNKGRQPGQSGMDAIAYVERNVNNNKETIALWTASGKYPEHTLRRDNDKALVTGIGINVPALVAGTKYPVQWQATWIVTANMNDKGTYFRDVTAIRNLAAVPA